MGASRYPRHAFLITCVGLMASEELWDLPTHDQLLVLGHRGW